MCEQCYSFDRYYQEDSNKALPMLLESILASKLVKDTDKGRLERGKFSIVKASHVIKSIDGKDKELEKLEYIFKAKPSTEKKPHHGYCVFENFGEETIIHELFCDCQDYFFRLYQPFVKNGLATFDLEKKYKQREIHRGFGVHNKKPPVKTNPNGDLYLCKHLLHGIFFLLLGRTKDEKLKTDDKVELITTTPVKKEIIPPKGKEEPSKEPPKEIPKVVPKEVPKAPEKPKKITPEPEVEEPVEEPSKKEIKKEIKPIPKKVPEPVKEPVKVPPKVISKPIPKEIPKVIPKVEPKVEPKSKELPKTAPIAKKEPQKVIKKSEPVKVPPKVKQPLKVPEVPIKKSVDKIPVKVPPKVEPKVEPKKSLADFKAQEDKKRAEEVAKKVADDKAKKDKSFASFADKEKTKQQIKPIPPKPVVKTVEKPVAKTSPIVPKPVEKKIEEPVAKVPEKKEVKPVPKTVPPKKETLSQFIDKNKKSDQSKK